MPKIAYRQQRFNSKARKTVEQAKAIIEELGAQGYTLTLRQLYYQMVSRNFIANKPVEYERLGRIVTDAREIGEIDWYAIEDRGRGCYLPGHVPTPEEVLDGIERQLRLNPWLEQDVFLVVAVEKAALEGVIERPASRWRAPYMSCKGYLSASEAWRTGRRFEAAVQAGKRPVLLHLGDHDPSGLQMTEDNRRRISLFANEGEFDLEASPPQLLSGGIEVNRLALNMDQIEQYDPPPNPTKLTDSRASGYGMDTSWELDALSPKVIDELIHEAIKSYVDQERWEATLRLEAERRAGLRLLGMRWDEVEKVVLSDELDAKDRLALFDEVGYAAMTMLRGTGQEERLRPAVEGRRTISLPDPVKPDPSPFAEPTELQDGDDEQYEPEEALPEGYEEEDGGDD